MTITVDLYVEPTYAYNQAAPVNELTVQIRFTVGGVGFQNYTFQTGGVGINPIIPDEENEIFATFQDAVDHYQPSAQASLLVGINYASIEEYVFSGNVIYLPPQIQIAVDDLQGQIDGLSTVAGTGSYSDLVGKPTTMDSFTDGTTNKAYTATEKTKLSGIDTSATANDTDANLKARANHTGTQTASTISDFSSSADARITAQKGANSGLCPLDSGGIVASAYLPSYVDDVLEYANSGALPGTGVTGKIYVTTNDNKCFRWSGSTYVEVSPGPGSTDSITEGSVNLYFTPDRSRSAAQMYSGTTQKLSSFHVLKNGTTSSGTVAVHLTTDGTSGGTALFPNGVDAGSFNFYTNDSTNIYTYSHVLSNSNKTLTVTAKRLNLLALGLQNAADGTTVYISAWGN